MKAIARANAVPESSVEAYRYIFNLISFSVCTNAHFHNVGTGVVAISPLLKSAEKLPLHYKQISNGHVNS
jgi:hypothetical protein